MVTDETSYTTYVLYLQDFTNHSIEPSVCLLGHAGGRARGLDGSWMGVGGK
jgi:hypothetical protein